MAHKIQVLCTIFISFATLFFTTTKATTFNVMSYGAKPDRKTDSTPAFLKAWSAACSLVQTSTTMYVPPGNFTIKPAVFKGPCGSRINVVIDGTLVAPDNYWDLGNSGYWLLFVLVNKLSIYGGTLDAKGTEFWKCRLRGGNCPAGARSLTFNYVNDGLISGLTSLNSQLMHIVINSCNNVRVQNVKTIAPALSPNTDGIHVQISTGVTIYNSNIQTGDDCISIGPGTRNLWMEQVKCGPGHGVSIGSLARDLNEDGVMNVTLINSEFRGSDNGVRIKSWARPSTAFVTNINFRNLIMKNVANPIIIDQNYCPNNQGCPRQASGVKINQVLYQNIQGTSSTPFAVLFYCSPSNPCRGIIMEDIKITYLNSQAKSFCNNMGGTTRGVYLPERCL
ncbi:OLC1v1007860C1 [Oldenlandia corymbosa var. corymbosa]|uniref:OLC1v1007860C1 n=1 Tax=Oldenlandia corymbosa var. corymbosa TaxID=529605 RepID=A0AAV1DMM7_OLDCO|nr:OLC1v1007860C1 [Oldenlandia corymbosa var. corymbosa]